MTWERSVAENAWQLDDGLYRILLPLPWAVPFVNAFLVGSRAQFALIDCGANWLPSLRALGRALKAIGVPPRGLSSIVLTHRHPDHAGGAGPVQQRWGGRVLLHPLEWEQRRIDAVDLEEWLEQHGVDDAIRTRPPGPPREPLEALPERLDPLPVDQSLAIGDLSLQVIHVPGHAPGQVMLWEPRRGWLFTADHVLEPHAPNVWAFPGTGGDPLGEYLDSLERTRDLDATLLLPGHGKPLRANPRDLTTAMIDFHRQFAGRVRAALDGKQLTAWEIVKLTRSEPPTDPAGARFALAEVLAALTYLEKRGAVSQAGEGQWVAADDVLRQNSGPLSSVRRDT